MPNYSEPAVMTVQNFICWVRIGQSLQNQRKSVTHPLLGLYGGRPTRERIVVVWVKLKLADEDRQRTFNFDQVLWWEGFGDECELTMVGTGPVRVRVSHYEMELLTNSLPRAVGD